MAPPAAVAEMNRIGREGQACARAAPAWRPTSAVTGSAADYGIAVGSLPKNQSFEINGLLDTTLDAVRLGTSGEYAQPVDFRIGKTGTILSDANGINTYGEGHVIRNAGTIEAAAPRPAATTDCLRKSRRDRKPADCDMGYS